MFISGDITPKTIDMGLMMKIFNEIHGTKITDDIKDNADAFPIQQKVLICSLLLILKNSKTKNISLGKVKEI